MADTVLVTGAGGCIAAWVLRELDEQGASIVAFDLRSRCRQGRWRAQLTGTGTPFPIMAALTDAPATLALGSYRQWSLDQDVADTMQAFRHMVEEGKLGPVDVPWLSVPWFPST